MVNNASFNIFNKIIRKSIFFQQHRSQNAEGRGVLGIGGEPETSLSDCCRFAATPIRANAVREAGLRLSGY